MPRRDLSINSLTGQSALFDLNDKLGLLDDLTHNFDDNGVLADVGLATNIPRFTNTSFIDFIPVYSANAGGTFTATVVEACYRIYGTGSGRSMKVILNLNPCIIIGAPTELFILIPGNWLAYRTCGMPMSYLDDGVTYGTGRVTVTINTATIGMRIDFLAATAWTASALTRLNVEFEFRIRK